MVGSHVTVINNAILGDGCHIGDHAIVSGAVYVRSNVRVGAHAFIAAGTALDRDVVPFGLAAGDPAYLRGVNIVGLRRRSFTRGQIHDLRRAYRLLFAEAGLQSEWVEEVAREFPAGSIVHEMLGFIARTKPGAILKPQRAR